MKLKKIFAVVSAAVLMATMSLPVFAEATPGESSQSTAIELIGMTQNPEMNVAEAENKMKDLTGYLQDTQATISSEMMTAAMSFFDRMEDDNSGSIQKKEATVSGIAMSYRSQADDTMQIKSLSLDQATGKITLDAEAVVSGNDSFGYAVTVDLPADTRVTTYKITMEGDNAQKIDATVPVKSYIDKDNTTHKYVTFWVPHFTTYVLTSFSNDTAAETTTTTTSSTTVSSGDAIQYYTCKACGYHNWTATEEGYRCDNCGYIESQKQLAGYGNVKGVYSPKTGTENPIKATGSDMNLTVLVVVALAVAAACGMGVVSKKSRKSE